MRFKPAHAAVGSAFDTDIVPEIVVTHDHPQDLQRSRVRIAGFFEIAAHRHILYLSRSHKALVFLFRDKGNGSFLHRFVAEHTVKLRNAFFQNPETFPVRRVINMKILPAENIFHQLFQVGDNLFLAAFILFFQFFR